MNMKQNAANTFIFWLIIAGGIAPIAIFLLIPKIAPQIDITALYRPEAAHLLPRIDFSTLDQAVVCFASFGLKPLYELISLAIIIKLWRNTDIEAVALRYGLIAFFIGENGCALNYLLFKENSLLLEYIHLYGMLVSFGFISYSALIVLDRRMLQYSSKDKRCGLLFFCRYCYKNNPVPCTLRRMYQLLAAAVMVLSLMPLTARLGGYFVAGDVFGTEVIFGHSIAQQIIETRICPVVAIFFFFLAWLVLHMKKEDGFDLAKRLFSAGLGALGFSIMRFIAFWGFQENPIWADIWEEVTEFIFISSVFYLLFLSKGRKRTRLARKCSSNVRVSGSTGK